MIIDGKKIAQHIQQELSEKIKSSKSRPPCLAVVLVGTHLPSEIYVKKKTEACERIGMRSLRYQFPENTTETDLLSLIEKLNHQQDVDGILIQLPLPAPISTVKIIQAISPHKDVDGLHPVNAGKLLIGEKEGFVPCTPLGIKVLLERSGVHTEGKHVVVMGRSNLVGKPVAALLLQNAPGANATVTVVHSYSKNLKDLSLMADILIAAIGKPQFVTADMIKPGSVVIDVGINRVEDAHAPKGYRIVGDVDFDQVQNVCSMITPVPNGVGPMTITMLLSNTYKSFCQRQQ